MLPISEWKSSRLVIKRNRKTLKRRRKGKIFNPHKKYISCKKVGIKQKERSKTLVISFLQKEGFYDEFLIDENIVVPKDFSLRTNYKESLNTLKSIFSTILNSNKTITISFSACTHISLAVVCLLKVVFENYKKHRTVCNSLFGKNYSKFPKIRIQKSKSPQVNHLLYAARLSGWGEGEEEEMKLVAALPFIVGGKNRKSYSENAKGQACNSIKNFLNKTLASHKFELSPIGINVFERLITEILNNAEDHTTVDEWYVMGTLRENNVSGEDDVVGQLDLIFLNFGPSIYQGFEDNKRVNQEVYDEMAAFYNQLVKKYPRINSLGLTRENLFTLYALQEGYSRLKYLEDSRGTGTVNFLKAFIELGSHTDDSKGYKPHLAIISGKTIVICDNEFKPFTKDEVTYLSLNKEQDLFQLPSLNHLKTLDSYFPGTLLSVKIYVSSKHLHNIANNH